ncbi:MAG: chemotaxis protein CheW [Gammaproteobacteria bacterium]|nr:chemotaxis protein CheW [Gammaproteobacteria bacterium]
MKNRILKLYMQFYVNSNRYVLPARDIVAIVPVVSLHEVPQAPVYVVGILNYHGESVPVIDIRALMTGKRSDNHLSTRIAIVRFDGINAAQRLIGVLAEKLTEVMRIDESQFKPSGVTNDNARYLGDVVTDNRGILQRLKVSELLPKAAQKMLFG